MSDQKSMRAQTVDQVISIWKDLDGEELSLDLTELTMILFRKLISVLSTDPDDPDQIRTVGISFMDHDLFELSLITRSGGGGTVRISTDPEDGYLIWGSDLPGLKEVRS